MTTTELFTIACTNPLASASSSRLLLKDGTLWMKRDRSSKYTAIMSFMGDFIIHWVVPNLWSGESQRTQNMLRRYIGSAHSVVATQWMRKIQYNAGCPSSTSFPPDVPMSYYSDEVHAIESSNSPEMQEKARRIRDVSLCVFWICPGERWLEVKRPGKGYTRMLAMGVHPETGQTREEMVTNNFYDAFRPNPNVEIPNLDTPSRNVFHEEFEKQLRILAYGAVCKENTLRDMRAFVLQSEQNLQSKILQMNEEFKKQAATDLAPQTWEASGLSNHHLVDLYRYTEGTSNAITGLNSGLQVLRTIMNMPDSMIPYIEHQKTEDGTPSVYLNYVKVQPGSFWTRAVNPGNIRAWTNHWNKRGSLGSPHGADPIPLMQGSTESAVFTMAAPLSESFVGWTSYMPKSQLPFVFADMNQSSFSYYWVRRNFRHYQKVMGQMNFVLAHPFNRAPEEWDQLLLAAPVFMTEDSNHNF